MESCLFCAVLQVWINILLQQFLIIVKHLVSTLSQLISCTCSLLTCVSETDPSKAVQWSSVQPSTHLKENTETIIIIIYRATCTCTCCWDWPLCPCLTSESQLLSLNKPHRTFEGVHSSIHKNHSFLLLQLLLLLLSIQVSRANCALTFKCCF